MLLGLLLFKLSAFHIYEEHDGIDGQENHCEFCLLVIENQQLDTNIEYPPNVNDVFIEKVLQVTITAVDKEVYPSPSKKEQLPRPPPST